LDRLVAEAEANVTNAAAPVVETVDAQPVNKKEERSLYATRVKIHPKRAQGVFRRVKWIVMAVTLAIYYLAPWIRWDRGPNAPDQAILLDFPARRFYFFFIEIWPQEVYYITGLLILASFGLFLITSVAGRVWCGYTCPQTVWTDLFVAVERFIEGDRNARIKLDRASWTFGKIGKRLVKHTIWILIAVLTGGAWVFYFADAPVLAVQLLTFEAPAIAYISIAIFTATTYLLGGLAREQVCTYMCPWPRIQGAMFDEDSLLVSYRPNRGEPRGKHKKGESWDARGHCIDCNQCVAVCPMGIDIRDGPQLECIQCALCIDACNVVMKKVGLPADLIAYDTYRNLAAQQTGQKARLRIVRPRTIIYAALIVVVGLVMLATLLTRDQLDVNVLRDRNPLFVTLSDGSIRNGYTVKILNKLHDERKFEISARGIDSVMLSGVGMEDAAKQEVSVKADRLRSIRMFVTVRPEALNADSLPLEIIVTDVENGTTITYDTVFRGPE